MVSPLTSERVTERGTALARWLAAGGDIDRLLRLDQRVCERRYATRPHAGEKTSR